MSRYTVKESAERLGVSESVIRRFARNMGLNRFGNPYTLTDEDIKTIDDVLTQVKLSGGRQTPRKGDEPEGRDIYDRRTYSYYITNYAALSINRISVELSGKNLGKGKIQRITQGDVIEMAIAALERELAKEQET